MAIRSDLKSKPIFLILQGPSALKHAPEIKKFEGPGVLWASLNRIEPVERMILPEKESLDLFYCSSQERFREVKADILAFCMRPERLLFTNYEILAKEIAGNPYFYADTKVEISNLGWGFSSLVAFLIALLRLGANKIFLFGADGVVRGSEVYFCPKAYPGEDFLARAGSIWLDTVFTNRLWAGLREYWASGSRAKIYNVNPESALDCFEKISIETVRGLL